MLFRSGNECDVLANALKRGLTVSCGCYNREIAGLRTFKDLTGQRFGMLVVQYRAENQEHPSGQVSTMWHCKCDCGNEKDVVSSALYRGLVRSCGCNNTSKYEMFVNDYLQTQGYVLGLDYDRQYKFNDLKGYGEKGTGRLSYDFVVFKPETTEIQCLIECQGVQHYEPIEIFGGEQQFIKQQEYDSRKRQYAKKHGYELIEISYTIDTYEKVADYLKKNGL